MPKKANPDFTQAQAARWIAQEAAKITTPADAAKRIATEEQTMALCAQMGMDKTMPVSTQAHRDLISLLRAAF
jgi:hypothetical protein